jgi:hypothetical protein
MSEERIHDPQQPNLHGYTIHKRETRFIRFCWWLYGRNDVVAWYLHREQTFLGRLQNWAANRILNYLYSP